MHNASGRSSASNIMLEDIDGNFSELNDKVCFCAFVTVFSVKEWISFLIFSLYMFMDVFQLLEFYIKAFFMKITFTCLT